MTATIRQILARRDNDYDADVFAFLAATGIGWHELTPAAAGAGRQVSVVIPARDSAYSLPAVLDALAAQQIAASVEVVVVDDASIDATPAIAAAHPIVTTAVRLPQRVGAGAARNVGTALASADTLIYLDADMVLPPHVIGDIATRAADDLVLVGFRHGIPYEPGPDGRAMVPAGEPDLAADHRVVWHPPAGVPLLYTGIVLDRAINGRPLDDTREFRDLGHGRRYYDWDLPRMVVTALLAVPRAAVLAVGGFDPAFGAGWGCDDTYLGALLIAAGCAVVPLRQARGWHIDPPDATAAWKAKLATAPANIAHYWAQLDQPMPTAQRRGTATETRRVLAVARRLR